MATPSIGHYPPLFKQKMYNASLSQFTICSTSNLHYFIIPHCQVVHIPQLTQVPASQIQLNFQFSGYIINMNFFNVKWLWIRSTAKFDRANDPQAYQPLICRQQVSFDNRASKTHAMNEAPYPTLHDEIHSCRPRVPALTVQDVGARNLTDQER